MTTLKEAVGNLFSGIFPDREEPFFSIENQLEIVDMRLEKLETFTVGVLVGQGKSDDEAMETVRRLED